MVYPQDIQAFYATNMPTIDTIDRQARQ